MHHERRRMPVASVFKLLVSVPVLAVIVIHLVQDPSESLNWDIFFWTVSVAGTELLQIPTKAGVQLSLSFPLLLAALLLYDPISAATIAFVGTFDRRELSRSMPAINALFNR